MANPNIAYESITSPGTIGFTIPSGYTRCYIIVERITAGTSFTYEISGDIVTNGTQTNEDGVITGRKQIENYYSFSSKLHNISLSGASGDISINVTGGSGARILNAMLIYF